MYTSIMWKYMSEEKGLLTNLLNNKETEEKCAVLKDVKALYIVALFMQKNILRFSQTFLQKVIAISQIICYNSRARVE